MLLKPHRIVFLCLISGIVFNSCNKDNDSTLQILQDHDWEQLSRLPGNSSYYMDKYFYKVRFLANDSYFMEATWDHDTASIGNFIGKYDYDENRKTLDFPDAVDTIYNEYYEDAYYFLYFCRWKIHEINDTLLVIAGLQAGNPPMPSVVAFSGDTLYFRPK